MEDIFGCVGICNGSAGEAPRQKTAPFETEAPREGLNLSLISAEEKKGTDFESFSE